MILYVEKMVSFEISKVIFYSTFLYHISEVLTDCTNNKSEVININTPDFLTKPSLPIQYTPVNGSFTFSVKTSGIVNLLLIDEPFAKKPFVKIQLKSSKTNVCSISGSDLPGDDKSKSTDCMSDKYWVISDTACKTYQLGKMGDEKPFLLLENQKSFFKVKFITMNTIGDSGVWEIDVCPSETMIGRSVCSPSASTTPDSTITEITGIKGIDTTGEIGITGTAGGSKTGVSGATPAGSDGASTPATADAVTPTDAAALENA